METRICKQCGIEKPMICYKSEIKNGKKYYRWSCNECEKSKKSKYNKKYEKNNKEKIRRRKRKWAQENKQRIYKIKKEKRDSNETYREIELLRTRIRKVLNKSGNLKSESLEKILGCTTKEFYIHLLETYEKNYKNKYDDKQEVNIDHIIPLATAKTKEEVYKLFHYSNLQLLKTEDNMDKSTSLEWTLKDNK